MTKTNSADVGRLNCLFTPVVVIPKRRRRSTYLRRYHCFRIFVFVLFSNSGIGFSLHGNLSLLLPLLLLQRRHAVWLIWILQGGQTHSLRWGFFCRWCSRFWKHVLWVSLIFCLIECRNSTNNKKFISLSLMANQPRSLFAYLLYSFQTSFYIKNCRISQVSNSHRQRRTRSTLTARPTTSRCWEKVIKFF